MSLRDSYRILVIGGGGREHALCWKIRQSKRCKALFCAPGNPGTASAAENVPMLDIKDHQQVVRYCLNYGINLVVIGPEDPLVAGLADDLREAGILVFGPGKAGAQLEGSKWAAKSLMKKYGIPTAEGEAFSSYEPALAYLRKQWPQSRQVIKADGLAAGKGVVVPETLEEAEQALREMFAGKFGRAGEVVVIEEFMKGRELSVLVITDGIKAVMLPEARDHKRLYHGDVGPNTGGMGAYSPVPDATDEVLSQVARLVVTPLLHGLRSKEIEYRGVIYCGLMICEDGLVRVVEFNCRFGDPETQVVLARLKSDLVPLLVQAAEGALPAAEPEIYPGAAVCVVLAASGYATKPKVESGKVVHGLGVLDEMTDVVAFHAGTTLKEGVCLTSGGRVLGITGVGETIAAARRAAYAGVSNIVFDNMQFRTDIALNVAE